MNKNIVVESFNMEFQIPQLPGYQKPTQGVICIPITRQGTILSWYPSSTAEHGTYTKSRKWVDTSRLEMILDYILLCHVYHCYVQNMMSI